MQRDQTVSEMAQEVLARQAEALARGSGRSLEEAIQAVSDTEAGRRLRDLANDEHRHEKAREWQARVFWERAEERLMHLYSSEALSRLAVEGHYWWLEGYLESWKARSSEHGTTTRSSRSKTPTPFRACEKDAAVTRLR
jgi:hypothetical protein